MSSTKNALAASEASDGSDIIGLTQQLLNAIASGDWQAYRNLVADDITCFEPEASGHLVAGLAFHEFYFKLPHPAGQPSKPVTTSLASPVVRMLSADAALIAYVRLTQTLDDSGHPITKHSEETRIWQRIDGRWQHVHFHRSLP